MPPLRTLAWPQQIAEKICEVFEQHGGAHSSRARDLADLGMIAKQVDGLDGTALIDALKPEAARRAPTSMPDGLPAAFALGHSQETEWRANFKKASRSAPIDFDEALANAGALVGPLLDGSATGLEMGRRRTPLWVAPVRPEQRRPASGPSSGEGLQVRCGYAGRTPSVTLTVFVLPFRVTLTLTTSDGL